MADSPPANLPANRPLSPHLQVFRPFLTMMMSITHRVTGAALYVGTLLMVWWLLAAASGPNAYATFQNFIGSVVGQIILFGYTWALIQHLFGGLRHLVWDLGYGFGATERELMARVSLFGPLALALVLWVLGYMLMGGQR